VITPAAFARPKQWNSIGMCRARIHLTVARKLTAAWRDVYNHHRPHSSLGYVAPVEFAVRCAASIRATPSLQQHSGTTLVPSWNLVQKIEAGQKDVRSAKKPHPACAPGKSSGLMPSTPTIRKTASARQSIVIRSTVPRCTEGCELTAGQLRYQASRVRIPCHAAAVAPRCGGRG
jgi:hypothetical protein